MIEIPNRTVQQIHSALTGLKNREAALEFNPGILKALTDLCLHVEKLQEEVAALKQRR
jgi:hypothetical protein